MTSKNGSPQHALESDIQRAIMLATPSNARLFRNQVGTYQLADGRTVSSGMGKSTSDLVGFVSIIVTPEMVGKPVAVFTVCEVKRPGFRRDERARNQQRFIDIVLSLGGRGMIATSVEEAASLFR
jgi:hypothetical protein